MKVLFITYPRIGLGRGGLELQIEKTIEGLSRFNIDVIPYDPWKNQIPDVDICHIFSTDGTLVFHLESAAAHGKPVIMSPVFNGFTGQRWQLYLKSQLGQIVPGMYSDLKRIHRMVALSSKILVLNEEERCTFIRAFNADASRCEIVPNGFDTRFSSATPMMFESAYDVRNFILQVGSIEPNKNQLNVIRAINKQPYQLVIIGPTRPGYENYAAACYAEAGNNVTFLGSLPHDDPMLASAYAAAKLFILPSHREIWGLTLYEAAAASCRITCSRSVPLPPALKQVIPTFDAKRPASILTAIEREMNKNRSHELKEIVLRMASWEDVGRQIQTIYQNLAG